MASSREVVLTGMGTVSPLGIGLDAHWEAILQQQSGVKPLDSLKNAQLPISFGGEVRGFEPKQYVKPRKSLKIMSREIQIGVATASMAVQHADLDCQQVDSDRLGVILGCDFLYCDVSELADAYRACQTDSRIDTSLWGNRGLSKIFPLWLLKYLPNMPSCHIGIAHDARGPNNTITLGEASGLLAILEGVEVIRRGRADIILSGAVGSRLNITPIMFRGDENLSHRSDAPEKACRPFDADRDGMVNAEGAAIFVLEEREFAERRGANILAHVLGGCSRFETRLDGAQASGRGIRQSIAGALDAASIHANQIGHVNASGASTVIDDMLEARAIRECLDEVPVTAPRSYFGNLGAAAGAMELVSSVLALENALVPVSLNYETPDPSCPVNVVCTDHLSTDKIVALKLSQSSTGQAASLLLARQ